MSGDGEERRAEDQRARIPSHLRSGGDACALVTGAAGGIGRAVCLELAAQGWKVACCDRTVSEEDATAAGSAPPAAEATAQSVRDGGGKALALDFDVRDAEATRAAYERVKSELGPVGAVVANAAVVDRVRDAERLDPDAWRAELEVNLTGAFLSLQPALAGMRERGGGRIVAIASTAATDGLAGQAAYAASKAGLLGLVRTLALEMAPAGVTVNAVLPGMVATEKVEAMPTEVRDRAVSHIPLRRFASPAEVASVVAFLCSDAASYVTGAWLPVDGGIGLSGLTLGRDR